jgi:hypothetical protein
MKYHIYFFLNTVEYKDIKIFTIILIYICLDIYRICYANVSIYKKSVIFCFNDQLIAVGPERIIKI